MFLELGVIGFIIAGWALPEIAILLGGGNRDAPPMLNILCGISAGLIAICILFSV
jgi:hypothetical protein